MSLQRFCKRPTVTIAPEISGYVVELTVDDNTRVKTGDLMVRIDPRDFVASRDQAAAALAVAKAQAENARINLQMVQVTAPARLIAAEAQLDGARANRDLADIEARRQESLGPNVSSQTAIDTAVANARSSAATGFGLGLYLYPGSFIPVASISASSTRMSRATSGGFDSM